MKIGIGLAAFCVSSTNVISVQAQLRAPGQGQAQQPQNHSAGAKYADDNLIITTSPNADMDKIKALLTEEHATVIKTLHINRDNYSILFVKPEKGKANETLKSITDKKDPNIQSIGRNAVFKAGAQ